MAKASFSAYVFVEKLLKIGENPLFDQKSTTNFGLPCCFFPFPFFCLKMAKMCCFCLAKSQKRRQKTRPPPYIYIYIYMHAWGRGKGISRRWEGGGRFLIENPRRGPPGQVGEGGDGVRRVFAGILGGGVKVFFSGPKFPPRKVFQVPLPRNPIF